MLGEGDRSAPAQGYKWGRLGDDGEIAGIADELGRRGKGIGDIGRRAA